jgi:hypothetical protein
MMRDWQFKKPYLEIPSRVCPPCNLDPQWQFNEVVVTIDLGCPQYLIRVHVSLYTLR